MAKENEFKKEDFFLYSLTFALSIVAMTSFLGFFFIDDHAVIAGKFANFNFGVASLLRDKTPLRTLFDMSVFELFRGAYAFRFFAMLASVISSFVLGLNLKHFARLFYGEREIAEWRIWLLTLFFLLHPSQVECLVWASNSRTVWAVLFGNLGVYLYLEFYERRNWTYWLGAYGAILVGVLFKPTIAPLFFVFIMIEYSFSGDDFEKKNWPNFLVVVGALSLGIVYLYDLKLLSGDVGKESFFDLILFRISLLGVYAKKMFIPSSAYLDYKYNFHLYKTHLVGHPLKELFLNFFMAFVFLALGIRYLIKKHSLLSFGSMVLLIMVIPYLGVVDYNFQQASSYADRYLQHLVIVLPFFILWGWKKWRQFEKIIIAILIFFFSLSVVNSSKWQNPKSLFEEKGFATYATNHYLTALSSEDNDCRSVVQYQISNLQLDSKDILAIESILKCLGRAVDYEGFQQMKKNYKLDQLASSSQTNPLSYFYREVGDLNALGTVIPKEEITRVDIEEANIKLLHSYLDLIDYSFYILRNEQLSMLLLKKAKTIDVSDKDYQVALMKMESALVNLKRSE